MGFRSIALNALRTCARFAAARFCTQRAQRLCFCTRGPAQETEAHLEPQLSYAAAETAGRRRASGARSGSLSCSCFNRLFKVALAFVLRAPVSLFRGAGHHMQFPVGAVAFLLDSEGSLLSLAWPDDREHLDAHAGNPVS